MNVDILACSLAATKARIPVGSLQRNGIGESKRDENLYQHQCKVLNINFTTFHNLGLKFLKDHLCPYIFMYQLQYSSYYLLYATLRLPIWQQLEPDLFKKRLPPPCEIG